MKRLSKEQIKLLHKLLLEETGGLEGIRDEGLLDSAISAPFQTFDGQYVYITIEQKAARLGFSLIKNHAFLDGNKRIGVLAMLTFLEINGIQIDASDEELIAIGLGVANSSMDDKELLKWILDKEN